MKKITERFVDEPNYEYDYYEIKIYGMNPSVIYFDPTPASTGSLKDGITFRFPDDGAWLISYKDLIKMAELAKEARKR